MNNGFSPSRRAWNRVMTVLVWASAVLVMVLVASSSLPCFTTDYFKNARERYPGRVFLPLRDPEADVTFYVLQREQKK